MNFENYDWSSFTVRISIRSSEKEIYEALSTQSGLEKWFLRQASFFKPTGEAIDSFENVKAGDTYKWLWHGYDNNTIEYGEIVEANGDNYLCFTFCDESAKTDMQVSISVKQEHDEIVVKLKQFNIPVDEEGKALFHINCMEGWVFYLTNLKSILEGGIDLRNKNGKLKKVINS